MKQISFVLSAFCVITLVSCGANEASGIRIETSKTNPPVLSTPSSPTTASPAVPAGYPAAPVIASSGLNPAHGQPGHRCDIAVGAVLPPQGSAPNLKLPTPTTPLQNTTIPVVQPQPGLSAATGLNP